MPRCGGGAAGSPPTREPQRHGGTEDGRGGMGDNAQQLSGRGMCRGGAGQRPRTALWDNCRGGPAMAQVTIECSEEILVALGSTPEQFEREARLALGAKLFEMGRLSAGRAGGCSIGRSSSPQPLASCRS
ncbi:MAG TPA: UPF0175 family protein [Vicinamibacteria bacterium]|nr:UPF0175 family protein [Vicinamibacteria bacterium]